MRRSPVVGAAFGLLSFYWITWFLFDLLTGRIGLNGEWVSRLSERGMAMLAGGLLGVGVVAYGIWLKRKLARMRLIGDDVRGVTCSIGSLPVMLHAPAQAKVVISADQLRLPKHNSIDPHWMQKWFDAYEEKYPAHAKMMRACEKVMNSKPNLPAACKNGERKGYAYGYDGHNHGNHTLVEHAYTTGAVGVHLAASFEFEGVLKVNDRGEKEGISKKNPNYRFEPSDPMVGLLCYAHDLGKVETFGFSDRGEVVAIESQHDLAGARMMARMDEFWELPEDDRMILVLAVGHYHKPSEMPLDRNGQLISDRCQALLEVVIDADIRAGLIENGQEDELGKSREVPIVEETYLVNLWRAFIELMVEAGRINGSRDKYGIGQKNVVDKRPLVIVYEKDVREELLRRMELRNSAKGKLDKDGIAVLTKDLLRVLDEHGMLVTESGDISAERAEDALWQVDWHGRDPKRAGTPISRSMCTIVFEPRDDIGFLAEMLDHDSVPKLVGLFGDAEHGGSRMARLREISLTPPAAGSEELDEVPQILEGTKSKKKEKKRPPAGDRAGAHKDAVTEQVRETEAEAPKDTKSQAQQGTLFEIDAACKEPVEAADAPTTEPDKGRNPRLTAALKGVQAQIREKVKVGKPSREGSARPVLARPSTHDPVKAGLLRVFALTESGDLPFEQLAGERIGVAVDALKALDKGIPWFTEQVVGQFISGAWPGVRVTRKDSGVFMLELDEKQISNHEPADQPA